MSSNGNGAGPLKDIHMPQIVFAVFGMILSVVSIILKCVEKIGITIQFYSRMVNSVDSTSKDSNQVAIDARDDQFPAKVDFPTTIRGFLSNMEREKPLAFSPKQIAEYTNNYTTTLLGSGAFGVVYKGLLLDEVEVAVKVLTNNNSAKIVEDQFMAEVGTLGRICHKNLVRLYGFCFHPELKALVYEYMENGSLDKLLFDENKQADLEKLHDIAVQIAQGLAYLHEGCGNRIIHYDIKPENVLLDENFNPKVADFGLAKLCNRGSSQMVLTNVRGTVGYAAPDVWKPYPVTHKCDVYSFGIVLFEIVGRRRHLDVNANESREWLPKWTWNMYNKNELAALVSRCGIEVKDKEKAERMFLVALLCIQNSPEARPIMSNVVKMLEGHMVIPPPPFPFEHGESPPRNLSQHSGTDEDSNTSASSTKTFEINEIEPVFSKACLRARRLERRRERRSERRSEGAENGLRQSAVSLVARLARRRLEEALQGVARRSEALQGLARFVTYAGKPAESSLKNGLFPNYKPSIPLTESGDTKSARDAIPSRIG